MRPGEFYYPNIDTARTGHRIQKLCKQRGITVKDIQKCLKIGSFQSVYNWFKGKTMPSLDNIVALGRLLKVPLEQMIICEGDLEREQISHERKSNLTRLRAYQELSEKNIA